MRSRHRHASSATHAQPSHRALRHWQHCLMMLSGLKPSHKQKMAEFNSQMQKKSKAVNKKLDFAFCTYI